MTKQLRAPILIDDATAEHVKKLTEGDLRCRKLGRIRPYGMNTDVAVFELLPPLHVDARITDEAIEDYEKAVDALTEGRWQDALELLNRMPVDDRTKDFLMIYIATNNYEAPAEWDGVIQMMQK